MPDDGMTLHIEPVPPRIVADAPVLVFGGATATLRPHARC